MNKHSAIHSLLVKPQGPGPTSKVIVVTDEDNDDVPVPPWVKIGEV